MLLYANIYHSFVSMRKGSRYSLTWALWSPPVLLVQVVQILEKGAKLPFEVVAVNVDLPELQVCALA